MAIKKDIKLDNGITVTYHRVVSVSNTTNIKSAIEVASYINQEEREKQMRYQELQSKNLNPDTPLSSSEIEELNKGINVLIKTRYISLPYDPNLNVNNAYEYLKEIDIFKGSEDV